MNDIVISWKNDNNYIVNLDVVFKKLLEVGLWLWKEKCFLMVLEVIYCGYEISGCGINLVEVKVKVI